MSRHINTNGEMEKLVNLALAGDRLTTTPSKHRGGESDPWRAVPERVKRRIIGLGWAAPHCCEADVLAQWAGERLGKTWTADDLVAFLVKAAPIVVRDRRRESHRRRHLAVARANHGPDATYYHRRTVIARGQGFKSLHDLCVARGWRTRKNDERAA